MRAVKFASSEERTQTDDLRQVEDYVGSIMQAMSKVMRLGRWTRMRPSRAFLGLHAMKQLEVIYDISMKNDMVIFQYLF